MYRPTGGSLQMFIFSRDNMTQLKPCDKLRFACLEFLCAILLQPVWRKARTSRQLVVETVDVLAPLVRHEGQSLAQTVRPLAHAQATGATGAACLVDETSWSGAMQCVTTGVSCHTLRTQHLTR